jgi:hypothetical protein
MLSECLIKHYATNSSCYPQNRTLGAPNSQSGRWTEEKNPVPLPTIEPTVTYMGEELAGFIDILCDFFLFMYTNKEACLQTDQ